jgi:hypothetical protein
MRKISKSEAHYSIAHADAIATTRLRATKTLAAISPRPSRGSVSVVFVKHKCAAAQIAGNQHT